MTPPRVSFVAIALAIVGIAVGGIGLYQTASVQGQLATAMATSQALSNRAQPAMSRIGVAPLEPAHPTDVANVARDPADLPPPLARTEPTTVKFTLTVEELTAQLADGATYDFWTFDGTVPGPMLRVMEGDTVELTLVNPAASTSGHNIDFHAVNGPGGGAAVTNVAPGESKTLTFKALNAAASSQNAGAFTGNCAGTVVSIPRAMGYAAGCTKSGQCVTSPSVSMNWNITAA